MSIFRKSLLTIGNENQTTGADLSDIDLTATTLDSRIKYQCMSSHAFIASDGTVKFAEPDVWPLEYRNGVAAGRSDPEYESSNLIAYATDFSRWKVLGVAVSATDEVLIESKIVQSISVTSASFPRVQVTPQLSAGKYMLSIIVKPGTASAIHGTVEDSSGSSNTTRFYVDLQTLETSVVVVSGAIIISVDASTFVDDWLVLKIGISLPADNGYKLFFGPSSALGSTNAAIGQNIIIAFSQLEQSALRTSSILTNGNDSTRLAAFASIANPGGLATSIRVNYSDGATRDIDAPAGGSDIQLAQSTTDWGTRFITRIQYAKGL